MNKVKMLLAAGVTGVVAIPTVAFAQQSAAETATDGDQGIADIVVTAQRREERLQNVPIAVTALNSAQLSNSGIATTQDLTTVTPSLTIGQNGGNVRPRLRGVGASFGGPGLENSIATYVDGVYIAAAPAGLFSLAGVERVEVLKGPQGTLFGRNATGGLIQVVTKKPSETFGGTASINYGNYDTFGGDMYMTGPLASGLSMDVAAHGSFQGDGFGRNRFLNIDANRTDKDISVRSQLMFRGNATDVRLAGDFSQIKGSQYEFRVSPFDMPALGPALPNQGTWDSNGNVPFISNTKSYGTSLTVNHELSFADLVSITAWRKSDLYVQVDGDTTPNENLSVFNTQNERQFTQELQLVSRPESPVSWLLGGYFFDGKSRYEPSIVKFGPALQDPEFPLALQRTFSMQGTRSYAVFGQATMPLGELTRLTAGLRYTSERKSFDATQVGILADDTEVPFGTRDDHVKYKKLTWRLSLDHRFTPDVMAYASINRGFKSGGFNPGGGIADAPFDPEQLDAYEIGLKADLFDRKVRFNPSLFYYDYQDLQITTFTPLGLPIFINGPSAKIYGLDLDFTVQPSSAFTVRGGLTVLHDRFGDFPDAPFHISNSPAPGNTLVFDNARGNRIPYTADWATTIAADYQIPTSFGKVMFSATYNHSDGYYAEVDNLRRQSAYDIVNGSVRIESDKGPYASVWARNLLNESVLLQVQASRFGGSAQFQAARTYGITVGTSF
ncbi:TonB-dependent receptor [Croceicoccus bisphenolivorans]|uniref:TonB-dependent receptor n=1 Tax=Croceicoccus bisphenolivorans TaxID=1783232 RepID=UPI001C12995E|nr:TonB-dependent receptor [Croceicoccus bisphenolivorans]